MVGSFTLNRKISLAFLDHANYFLQVFFAKAARFDEVDEERFGRAIKNTINEFTDHAADDLILGLRGEDCSTSSTSCSTSWFLILSAICYQLRVE